LICTGGKDGKAAAAVGTAETNGADAAAAAAGNPVTAAGAAAAEVPTGGSSGSSSAAATLQDVAGIIMTLCKDSFGGMLTHPGHATLGVYYLAKKHQVGLGFSSGRVGEGLVAAGWGPAT
jgi:hypothetical protein